jgi:hypothetical protein
MSTIRTVQLGLPAKASAVVDCSAAAAAGNSGPFWEMLVLLACCDKSTIVALEAIKGLAGMSTYTLPGVRSTHGCSKLP